MKKFLSLLFGAMITLSGLCLAACNNTGGGDSDSSSDSSIEEDLGVEDIYNDGYGAPAN